jgi:hypothetical protein
MDTSLANLPFNTQVTLACGYAAYCVAHHGRRGHHQAIDIAFSTLVFGLLASSCYTLVQAMIVTHLSSEFAKAWSAILTLVIALIAGGFWSRFGRRMATALLRSFSISYSDETPSALLSLAVSTEYNLEQVAVRTTDGRYLRCDDAPKFGSHPHGPCKIGPNGDIALYLTHTEDDKGVVKELKSVIDPQLGSRITYVPANNVSQINFRYAVRT